MSKGRRGRGEDSLYKDGDRWRGAISLGLTPDGRRRRIKVSGATKAEVINKLKKAAVPSTPHWTPHELRPPADCVRGTQRPEPISVTSATPVCHVKRVRDRIAFPWIRRLRP